jgi:hypothetical protein
MIKGGLMLQESRCGLHEKRAEHVIFHTFIKIFEKVASMQSAGGSDQRMPGLTSPLAGTVCRPPPRLSHSSSSQVSLFGLEGSPNIKCLRKLQEEENRHVHPVVTNSSLLAESHRQKTHHSHASSRVENCPYG